MAKYLILSLFLLNQSIVGAQQSTCYGKTHQGRLENGVKLPSSGKNYVGYSTIARWLGRTYVHSEVKDIIIDAYKMLEKEQPNKVYQYAETGLKNGGRFKPHKTHQNGLSVDFMVPVIDNSGQSVHLPTHVFNKLGYSIEFNQKGEYGDLRIDYEALAAHLVSLHKEAVKSKHSIWRVIFDPTLQPYLFETKYGDYLKKHLLFSSKRSWVRHDEHYHVDFVVQCKK